MNCRFDPDTCVDTTIRMKTAVEKAGMKCHYMVQPVAYRTKDVVGRLGFAELPKCPLGKLESEVSLYFYPLQHLMMISDLSSDYIFIFNLSIY